MTNKHGILEAYTTILAQFSGNCLRCTLLKQLMDTLVIENMASVLLTEAAWTQFELDNIFLVSMIRQSVLKATVSTVESNV